MRMVFVARGAIDPVVRLGRFAERRQTTERRLRHPARRRRPCVAAAAHHEQIRLRSRARARHEHIQTWRRATINDDFVSRRDTKSPIYAARDRLVHVDVASRHERHRPDSSTRRGCMFVSLERPGLTARLDKVQHGEP
jgi:hypothetical protein